MPTLVQNKKAHFEYKILEKFEAGVVLTGQEVKSVRNGAVKLTGAFITFLGNTPLLTNAHIAHYPYASLIKDYDPTHSRKILLRTKEINYLRGKLEQKGLTIIPLSLYTKGQLIKLEIALCEGKKLFDKRRTIKERDNARELRRGLKGSLQ